MSIQPNRVVWRIVDEVARTPERPVCVVCRRSRDDRATEAVATACCASGPAGERFATLFHFWTHALRSFLELHGQADQLEGVAGYAMCEQIAAEALAHELEHYREPLAAGEALEVAGRVREAYRMIDGPCRTSIVIASERQWWALFRWHGARLPLPGVAGAGRA